MAEFREQDHPRDSDGRFTSGGKGNTDAFMDELRQQERLSNSVPKRSQGVAVNKTLYHQTTAKRLGEFNESQRRAGLSDIEVPKGIFLKDTNADIGLKGKNQLALNVKLENALVVDDRAALGKIVDTNDEIRKLKQKANNFDEDFARQIDEMSAAAETDEDFDKIEDFIAGMEIKEAELGKQIQDLTQDYLKELGYDGVIIQKDAGSFGRSIKSTIVFDLSNLTEAQAED